MKLFWGLADVCSGPAGGEDLRVMNFLRIHPRFQVFR